MPRAFLVVLDSAGIGGAPDAEAFFNGSTPDTGANTIGHIAAACANGDAEEGRSGPLFVPNLARLGLGQALKMADGMDIPSITAEPEGLWGAATEVSLGKDTPSGHWELAGVPVPWDWHVFPNKIPSFPSELIQLVQDIAGTEGVLGNQYASGTEIIDRLGEEHLKTGWPICYTSVDSVFQIAAHETHYGLDRLLDLCSRLAPRLHEMKVGRVIARPFVGSPGAFVRTQNRKDFAISPPGPTLCDWVSSAGRSVFAVGKIGDIFSMRGINEVRKGPDSELMEHLMTYVKTAEDGSLTFANFVEFDSLYGHRRDVSGYAKALEWFDAQIPALEREMRDGDLMIFTADHGNDPTWIGSDHTRERVPVLGLGLGRRDVGNVAFVDIAASIADHLGIETRGQGKSFL